MSNIKIIWLSKKVGMTTIWNGGSISFHSPPPLKYATFISNKNVSTQKIYFANAAGGQENLLLLMYTVAIQTMFKNISERDLIEFPKLWRRNYTFNNKATKKMQFMVFWHLNGIDMRW